MDRWDKFDVHARAEYDGMNYIIVVAVNCRKANLMFHSVGLRLGSVDALKYAGVTFNGGRGSNYKKPEVYGFDTEGSHNWFETTDAVTNDALD